jgi:hypothetical protein
MYLRKIKATGVLSVTRLKKNPACRCRLLSVKMCHGVKGCLGPGQGADRVKKGYQKFLAIVPLIFSVSDLNSRRDFGLNPDLCKTKQIGNTAFYLV